MNDIISEQLKIPVNTGIIINEVYINSPAEQAGLKRGDVVTRFDNQRVTGVKQFRDLLAVKKPGDTVRLVVVRDRRKLDIAVKTFSNTKQQAAQKAIVKQKKINLLKGAEIETGSAELVTVGFIAITLTPEVAFANGIPENTQGVIALETEGLALQAGMIDGDIIRAINGTPTPDLLSVLKKIKRCDVSKGITFSLIRQGQPCEVVVKENKPSLLPKGL
jgi:S1-C subfamily serine protease